MAGAERSANSSGKADGRALRCDARQPRGARGRPLPPLANPGPLPRPLRRAHLLRGGHLLRRAGGRREGSSACRGAPPPPSAPQVIARDRNLGDAVDVLPADDPGLPNGARLCPAALYDASNPAVSLCNVGGVPGYPATDPRLACSGNASQAHARFPAGAARAGCMRAGPPQA